MEQWAERVVEIHELIYDRLNFCFKVLTIILFQDFLIGKTLFFFGWQQSIIKEIRFQSPKLLKWKNSDYESLFKEKLNSKPQI